MNIYEELFWNNIRINIRYCRNKRKLTQEHLAEKCNLSYYYINEIESLKKNKTFSLTVLFTIANVLEVDIRELFS